MKPVVIMSIGVPGVGKTTRLKKLAQETGYVYVSADELRDLHLGDYRDHSDNDRIWAMAFKQIDEALARGESVLVDGSAITRHHRKSDIEHYRKAGADKVIGYWYQAPVEVAVERNHTRGDNQIPDGIIPDLHDKLNGFEKPELSDGFDEIKVINTEDK
jgi:predicted kinase